MCEAQHDRSGTQEVGYRHSEVLERRLLRLARVTRGRERTLIEDCPDAVVGRGDVGAVAVGTESQPEDDRDVVDVRGRFLELPSSVHELSPRMEGGTYGLVDFDGDLAT